MKKLAVSIAFCNSLPGLRFATQNVKLYKLVDVVDDITGAAAVDLGPLIDKVVPGLSAQIVGTGCYRYKLTGEKFLNPLTGYFDVDVRNDNWYVNLSADNIEAFRKDKWSVTITEVATLVATVNVTDELINSVCNTGYRNRLSKQDQIYIYKNLETKPNCECEEEDCCDCYEVPAYTLIGINAKKKSRSWQLDSGETDCKIMLGALTSLGLINITE